MMGLDLLLSFVSASSLAQPSFEAALGVSANYAQSAASSCCLALGVDCCSPTTEGFALGASASLVYGSKGDGASLAGVIQGFAVTVRLEIRRDSESETRGVALAVFAGKPGLDMNKQILSSGHGDLVGSADIRTGDSRFDKRAVPYGRDEGAVIGFLTAPTRQLVEHMVERGFKVSDGAIVGFLKDTELD